MARLASFLIPGSQVHDRREWNPSRRLEMRVGNRQTAARFYEISLKDQASGKETRSAGLVGPTLVVTQGQKTEIVINNALREPTSIHWLGIELESYYDGVPGLGGIGDKKAPAVEPGKKLRREDDSAAGRLVHVSHALARRSAVDRRRAWGDDRAATRPALRSRHSRFMNITPTMDNMRVSLRGTAGPVEWRLLAKDAADVKSPAPQKADQHIAVGETFDFAYRAAVAGELARVVGQSGAIRRCGEALPAKGGGV